LLARRCGFHAPILWIYDPMMAQAVGSFGEKLLVYHVLDNYTQFVDSGATALRGSMARSEELILRRADVVFAVSDRLRKRCLRLNPNVFLVPNGVNYELFRAQAAGGEVPSDMSAIPRPIIGHIGAIQTDLDFSLLRQMAIERPQWSLVFVGPEELGRERRKFEALLAQPNVHYLGCRRADQVPAYISCCDVCIMPYCPEASTVPDSDNVKLYEYLACGRPVVSTDVPSARRFLPLLRIATDPASFIRGVEESLTESPHFSELRKVAASGHSWRRRVALISECIVSRLPPGRAGGSRNRLSATGGMRP
jgi:glycosyltransferase involved in cell wall biosynthesis